jgi:hypothetical protein
MFDENVGRAVEKRSFKGAFVANMNDANIDIIVPAGHRAYGADHGQPVNVSIRKCNALHGR